LNDEAQGVKCPGLQGAANYDCSLMLARLCLLPRLEVAFGFFAGDREQAWQCSATRNFSFAEFFVFRGRESFLRHLIDDIRRDHQDTVAIADHDVARIHRDTATGDRQVEIAWMVRDRAWWR